MVRGCATQKQLEACAKAQSYGPAIVSASVAQWAHQSARVRRRRPSDVGPATLSDPVAARQGKLSDFAIEISYYEIITRGKLGLTASAAPRRGTRGNAMQKKTPRPRAGRRSVESCIVGRVLRAALIGSILAAAAGFASAAWLRFDSIQPNTRAVPHLAVG